jgi:hypothetical protein
MVRGRGGAGKAAASAPAAFGTARRGRNGGRSLGISGGECYCTLTRTQTTEIARAMIPQRMRMRMGSLPVMAHRSRANGVHTPTGRTRHHAPFSRTIGTPGWRDFPHASAPNRVTRPTRGALFGRRRAVGGVAWIGRGLRHARARGGTAEIGSRGRHARESEGRRPEPRACRASRRPAAPEPSVPLDPISAVPPPHRRPTARAAAASVGTGSPRAGGGCRTAS